MRIGAALLLIAVGAVLRFAITVDDPKGFNVHTAGVILIVVGAIGLVAELIYMSTRRRSTVVDQGVAPAATTRSTTTVVESPPPGY